MISRSFQLIFLLAPTLLKGGVGAMQMDAMQALADPETFGKIPEDAVCNEEFIECFRTHMAIGSVTDFEGHWQTLVNSVGEDHACTLLSGHFSQDFICGSCAIEDFPTITAECEAANNPNSRHARHLWQHIAQIQEQHRRILGKSDDDIAEYERKFQARRKLATSFPAYTCPNTKDPASIAYPVEEDSSYHTFMEATVKVPASISVTAKDDPNDDGNKNINFSGAAVLVCPSGLCYDSRTNQNNYAAVLIIGSVLGLVQEVGNAVCEAIPDPICVVVCGTNPIKVVCWVLMAIAAAAQEYYASLIVAADLHDGVIDGAEIKATLDNTVGLLESTCAMEEQINESTMSVRGDLNNGFCGVDGDASFTTNCNLKDQIQLETDDIDETLSDNFCLTSDTTTTCNLKDQIQLETNNIDMELETGFCGTSASGSLVSTCSLETTIINGFQAVEDLINARLDAVDAKLDVLHRLLLTPNGQRPSWNVDGLACRPETCPTGSGEGSLEEA